MTRTNGVASHRGSRLRYATPVHHSILQNKKISYTVKLERVKQLRKRTTYKLTPPPEYTFMPCGFPDITKYCKKVCTEQRLTVAFVSSPEAFTDPNSVSNNNNRIGYHFPKKVLNQALSVLGYVWMDGTVVKVADANDAFSRRVEELLTGGRPHHTTTEIAGVMRDLFPKMPEKDLMKIISHSFVEGSGRVGATTDIPLARKVQLAVGAHIRHTYTDYDRMLSWKRGFNVNRREEVRRQIEPAIVAKIREWRGDEGVEGDKIEDGFREVIEIPDSDDDDEVEVIEISDDDDEEDQDNVASSANESNRSAAYSSGPHLANAHQPNNRSGNALVAPRRLEQVPGVTFHEQHPRLDFAAAEPRILRQVPRATINQQNFRLDNALAESKTPRELPRAVFRQPVYYVKDDAVQSDSGGAYTAPSTRTTHRHGAASEPKPSSMRGHETFGRAYGRPELSSYNHPPQRPSRPLQGRDEKGQLINLEPVGQRQHPVPPVEGRDPARPSYMRTYATEHSDGYNRYVQQAPRPQTSGQDIVIPSIERESGAILSPIRNPDGVLPLERLSLKRRASPGPVYEMPYQERALRPHLGVYRGAEVATPVRPLPPVTTQIYHPPDAYPSRGRDACGFTSPRASATTRARYPPYGFS